MIRKSTRGEVHLRYSFKDCTGSGSRCNNRRQNPLYHRHNFCRKDKNQNSLTWRSFKKQDLNKDKRTS